MRLFVAVPLPSRVARSLAEQVSRAKPKLPDARWVRAENLHLTLVFFGETDPAKVPALERELAAALGGRPAFAARLAPAGAFPERGPVRIVWAGLEPEGELAALATAVRGAAAAAGLPFDAKPFRSHLTLARCARPWPPAVREKLGGLLGSLEGTEIPVDGVELVASVLGAGGSRYETVFRQPLGGEAA